MKTPMLLCTLCYLAMGLQTVRAEAPPPPKIMLPSIFSENMVLQRDVPIPVWGWGPEGEEIFVLLGAETRKTVVKDGRWQVTLPPMKAGGPYTLLIMNKDPKDHVNTDMGDTVMFTQVLVGEVWLVCGQSNMLMPVSDAAEWEQAVAECKNYPNIRVAMGGHRINHNLMGEKRKFLPMGYWGPIKWENTTYTVPRTRTETPGCSSALSYYFARELSRYLHGAVPIGMVEVGAILSVESWVDEETLGAVPELAYLKGKGYPHASSACYNANIAPLLPFPVRGFIYYQGEMNGGRGLEYRASLPALIRSWRKAWGDATLPFLIVQLPGFVTHEQKAATQWDMDKAILDQYKQANVEHGFCGVREAQFLTWRTVPKTGLAVTLDLGEPFDIHPKRKREVAERVFLQARQVAYGEANLVASGPVFEGCRFNGAEAILTFSSVGAGLVAQGGALKGFELSADGKTFVPATATIADATVVVRSTAVPTPTAVRYAWAGFPEATLFNKDGLPASPFRFPVPEK